MVHIQRIKNHNQNSPCQETTSVWVLSERVKSNKRSPHRRADGSPAGPPDRENRRNEAGSHCSANFFTWGLKAPWTWPRLPLIRPQLGSGWILIIHRVPQPASAKDTRFSYRRFCFDLPWELQGGHREQATPSDRISAVLPVFASH